LEERAEGEYEKAIQITKNLLSSGNFKKGAFVFAPFPDLTWDDPKRSGLTYTKYTD
jgi:hypothetical protein